jgi:hypothetical protein
MAFMTPEQRAQARVFSDLAVCNPFVPERVDLERRLLGPAFAAVGPVWHARSATATNPNIGPLAERAGALADALRDRLVRGTAPGADAALYEDLVTYLLYTRAADALFALIIRPGLATAPVPHAPALARDLRHYLAFPALGPPPEPAPLLGFFFQIRRAFHFTMEHILGASRPAARLRARVWEAIFGRDVRRYRRALLDRMHDFTTLIVGPSGTGKELVARAIGHARFIPFDPAQQRFVEDFREAFFPLSISALPSTLIESELFGHKRGAFTGASADRRGWLEVCPRHGTVFLDEVAEIDAPIQVKLLRVLQARTFQRVGETRARRFEGKIVAATHRDLATEIQAGRFRPDLYYRLCSDVIETPSLAAQLRDDPGELGHLLRFLAERVAGDAEADALAQEAEAWITTQLGTDYPWPGNVRELEQCVRAEHPHPRGVPATPPGRDDRRGGGPRARDANRGLHRGGPAPPLLHAGLRADGELPGDGAPPRDRPADREGEGGCGAAGAARRKSAPGSLVGA